MASLHHNGRAGPWQHIIMLQTHTDYKRGRVLFVHWQHYRRIIAQKQPHTHIYTYAFTEQPSPFLGRVFLEKTDTKKGNTARVRLKLDLLKCL